MARLPSSEHPQLLPPPPPLLLQPNKPASGGGDFGVRPRLQVRPGRRVPPPVEETCGSQACPPTRGGACGAWPRPRPCLARPLEEEPAAPSLAAPVPPPYPAAGAERQAGGALPHPRR